MVDLDKFICSLFDNGYGTIGMGDIKEALKQQGLEYKDGAIKPIKEPVNFEEFPREEQLKWYICIKSIPQKDGGFMPLFCEGEHATIEKIFDMLPELKNDTALFTEHFRKVTEVDLSKESDTESFDYEHATIKQKDFATTKKTDIEIKVGDWCVDKEGWYGGKPFKKIGENTKDKMLNGEMGTFFKAQFQDGSTFFPNVEHVRKATEAEIPVEKPTLSPIFKGEWYICIKPINYFTVGKIYYAISDWVLRGDLGYTVDVRTPDCFRHATKEDIEKQTTRLNPSTIEMLENPPTIKFNGPDIDAMVDDFWNNKDVIISSHTRGMVEGAYRQGLEDMWNKLKSK